jgi:RNA polymerase sigma factor (sigma-70 family)
MDLWFTPRLRPVDALRGWLVTITFNECVNHARKYRSRSRRKVVSFTLLDLKDGQSFATMIQDSREFDLDAFEIVGIVNASLADLTEDEHQLYSMPHVDGLSQREIAVNVRASAPTICRRQRQLRRKLEALLARRGVNAELWS